jgi:hypothetical protein
VYLCEVPCAPLWLKRNREATARFPPELHTGFNEIVNKIDMAGSIRAEAGFGRFGLLAESSYFSLSDSVGADGVVRKLDFREDETRDRT